MATEFRILGELEVVQERKSCGLGSLRQRGLLARLLIRAGQPITTDRLIEDPGLNPPAVPALGGSRLALLAALLGITAMMEMRSRARARACPGPRRNLQEEARCDN